MVVLWLVFEATGLRRLVVAHDHPQQQAQHEQGDHRDDRHQDGVVNPQAIVAKREY
jgi:hypothetical protein